MPTAFKGVVWGEVLVVCDDNGVMVLESEISRFEQEEPSLGDSAGGMNSGRMLFPG